MERVLIEIGNKQYKCKVAKNEEDRRKGLMEVDYLPSDEGMLFVWEDEDTREMWMKNTKIPLDIIGINDDEEVYLGKVVMTKHEVSYGTIKSNHDQHLNLRNMLELLYPIGSIYTSMNDTNPELLFGFGSWTQIVDRFLYCTYSSKQTGGSKKITVEQLPAHSHSITELDIRGNENGSNQYTIAKYGGNDTTIKTGNTGGGKDYMPPYLTVFCWYRTA